MLGPDGVTSAEAVASVLTQLEGMAAGGWKLVAVREGGVTKWQVTSVAAVDY